MQSDNFFTGVITGVIISAIVALAMAPLTARVHLSVQRNQIERQLEDLADGLRNLPQLEIEPPPWQR